MRKKNGIILRDLLQKDVASQFADEIIPHKVFIFEYEKDGNIVNGYSKCERINQRKDLPRFKILEECYSSEIKEKSRYYRFLKSNINHKLSPIKASLMGKNGAKAAEYVRTKEWHSKGGSAKKDYTNQRDSLKKLSQDPDYYKNHLLPRGKALVKYLQENPQVPKDASKLRWKNHRDNCLIAAKANLLLASKKAMESPKFWEWVNSDAFKEAGKEGGSKSGKIAAENGFGEMGKYGRTFEMLSNAGKKGGKIQTQKELKCPHCNKTGKSNGMYTWHFDNCKNMIKSE